MANNLRVKVCGSTETTFLTRALHGWVPPGWEISNPGTSMGNFEAELLLLGVPDYSDLNLNTQKQLDAHPFKSLSGNDLQRIREGNSVLVVDMSNEAPAASEIGAHFLVELLKDEDIPLEGIIFASMNAGLGDSLEPIPIRTYLLDSYALELAHNLKSGTMRDSQVELQRLLSRKRYKEPFLSLNSTPRGPRVALVAALMADELFGKNLVSWGGWHHSKAQAEIHNAATSALALLEQFLPDSVPFIDEVMKLEPLRFDSPLVDGNDLSFRVPWNLYAASSYSIVTEPTVTAAHWRVSEKTLKALIAGHFPVVFGHHCTYELLQKYGFEPFPLGLLTTHDMAPTPAKRLALMRETWRALEGTDREFLHDVRPILERNMEFAREDWLAYLRSSMVEPLFACAESQLNKP